MNNELIPFDFHGIAIRAGLSENGEPYFVASDVGNALELSNIRVSLSRLDDDEKGVTNVYTLGGPQQVAIVSEAGLYTLVLRSRTAEAKAFSRWVTHEVLPNIRKQGAYVSSAITSEQLEALGRNIEALKRRNADLEKTYKWITGRMPRTHADLSDPDKGD